MPTAERAHERSRERDRVRRLIRGAGLVGSVAIVALIAVGMSITYRYWEQSERRQTLVVQSYEVLDVGRQLLSTLQDAETGQRGYLLTGRFEYLAPYDQARLRLEGQISQLESLVRDDPGQARRAENLRGFATTKMQELENSIGVFRKDGREAALALVNTDSGNASMAGARGEMSALFSEQQALLGRRLASLREGQQRATLLAAATFGAALFALVIALLLSFRGVRRLSGIEGQLTARSTLLQSTLENLQDAIVVMAVDGEVLAWNESFSRLIGWKPGEHGYLSRADLLSERFPAARTLLADLLKQDPARLADGSLNQRVSLEGRDYEIGLGHMPAGEMVVTFLDVTDKIQADAVLRHAQKMEAIGQLTGGMAHDFNNILQVIQTNLDLLAGDVRHVPESLQRVETAQLGAQRAARLTRQLLAFARRQPLEPAPTDVGRLVQDMSDLLRHSLGEQVELDCVVQPGAWNARVDSGQLENAIINLAVNARDAMPEGGRLSVEVSNVNLRRGQGDLDDGLAPGEYVLVAVRDTGTGMPRDVVEKAFDPFFTTKEEGKGTGLGLSMVYGFINQSGGLVKIESAPGRGTTVRMYLPRTRESVADAHPARSATLEGSERILVVEDNDGVRYSLVEMLRGLRYQVTAVDGPDSAMKLLKDGASFDLLLSDVVMPGKIGAVELAAGARQLRPNIAVLFMSGYAQNSTVQNELPPGTALLSKPFRRDELAMRIRAALSGAPNTAATSAAPAPAAEPPATPAAQPTTHGRDRMRLGCHVLLVEDEVLVRMSTADSLRRLGCTVEAVGSAEQALAALARDNTFNLLITDIGLPGMSGHELVDAVRKINPRLVLAIASGYRETQKGDAASGDVHYLVKPYSVTDLRPLLERAGAAPRSAAD